MKTMLRALGVIVLIVAACAVAAVVGGLVLLAILEHV